jgi:hypothetical protein
MAEMIEFEWIVPESEKDALVTAIEVAGGTVDDSGSVYRPTGDEEGDYLAAGFEPLTMIVAAASVVFVVQAVMKLWRDRRAQGGVIVDTRGDKLRIRPVPTLPSVLVVVDTAGTKIVDKQDENVGKDLLLGVLAKLGK